MSDLNRVFFHELGHFIARELNAMLYGKAPVRAIEIYVCNTALGLYCGELLIEKSNHPKEGDLPTKDSIEEYLASSTYGCILQSLHLRQCLNHCFNHNGHDDYGKWIKVLQEYQLEELQIPLSSLEKRYFKSLKEDSFINDLLKINPSDFLKRVTPKSDNYSVDIPHLREGVADFLQKHAAKYQDLISQYRSLIAGSQ